MTIKIYKPSKTAMQSGIGKTKKWLAEYISDEETVKDHLMGWNSSSDTKTQIITYCTTIITMRITSVLYKPHLVLLETSSSTYRNNIC